ncbi:MAG TPA: SRPBCC domain-containing protein [Allosphingosinicella sp.]|jgi:uncharacterized protein YndB with AHSA1/START domain
MDGAPPIEWRVHVRSSPEAAYEAWTKDAGRSRFWAEESRSGPGGFELRFVNGQALAVEVVEAMPATRLVFRYFGGSTVTLAFEPDGRGGCDLYLREEGVPAEEHLENYAGWVSVLLAFKAAVDFGIDLRAHDPKRTWERRHVDC